LIFLQKQNYCTFRLSDFIESIIYIFKLCFVSNIAFGLNVYNQLKQKQCFCYYAFQILAGVPYLLRISSFLNLVALTECVKPNPCKGNGKRETGNKNPCSCRFPSLIRVVVLRIETKEDWFKSSI